MDRWEKASSNVSGEYSEFAYFIEGMVFYSVTLIVLENFGVIRRLLNIRDGWSRTTKVHLLRDLGKIIFSLFISCLDFIPKSISSQSRLKLLNQSFLHFLFNLGEYLSAENEHEVCGISLGPLLERVLERGIFLRSDGSS
jgi:hypothetical protein